MTEPYEVKLKAQQSAHKFPGSKRKHLYLEQVYKLIDMAYKRGLEDKDRELTPKEAQQLEGDVGF